MKIIATIISFFIAQLLNAQNNNQYDEVLAKKYGADDYGMKSYTLVILKSGNNANVTAEQRKEYFKGHFENINLMSKTNKLYLAGPIQKNEVEYRGLFVLNTNNKDTAQAWLMKDPTIKYGIFDVELYTWYGSAALPAYLEVHEKISKKSP